MATFETRKNGNWQAKIRRKGYPVQSRTFERKTDAEMWARDLENKMDRGIFVDRTAAENTTLAEALARYALEITPAKKGKVQEKVRINFWLKDKLSSRSLASLKSSDFAKWRDDRLKTVLPSTLVKDLALISHLFTVCRKEWEIKIPNPIEDVSKPTVNNSRERRFLQGEESKLMESLGKSRNIWLKPLAQLAIETAMRQGELLQMNWSDIGDNVIFLADTKNGTSRKVPVSAAAGKILNSLPRCISGKIFDTNQVAVVQAWTRGLARARKNYEFDCVRAGIQPDEKIFKDLRFHDLRHEATSRMAKVMAMHEVMKITGHRDPKMLTRYFHPDNEDLVCMLNKIKVS